MLSHPRIFRIYHCIRCHTAASNVNYSQQSSTTNHAAKESHIQRKSLLINPFVWKDITSLSEYLLQHVVKDSRQFVVINKPPSLSLLGHNHISQQSIVDTTESCHDNIKLLSVQDCLPILSKHFSVDKLFIAGILPYQYSGLFILSKNENFHNRCVNFFRKCESFLMRESLYQSILAIVCYPPKIQENPPAPLISESIPLPDDPNIKVSFKSTNPSRTKVRKGIQLTKFIGHRVLSTSKVANVALVEITTNSLYRSIVELYLLHEGSIIIGEHRQASRLEFVMGQPSPLPPEKTKLTKYPLRMNVRNALRLTKPESENIAFLGCRVKMNIPFSKGLGQ